MSIVTALLGGHLLALVLDQQSVGGVELLVQARPAFSSLDLDSDLGKPILGEGADGGGVAVAVHLVLVSHNEGVAEADELEAFISAEGDGFHFVWCSGYEVESV